LLSANSLYIFTVLYAFTVSSEAIMEHLVRVYNEKDRMTLEWLRRHVGDAAIAAAAERCGGSGKPYLSAICRRLGVRTPVFSVPRRQAPSPVAEECLATIRHILAARSAPAVSGAAARR
jgi:hypothetical protein